MLSDMSKYRSFSLILVRAKIMKEYMNLPTTRLHALREAPRGFTLRNMALSSVSTETRFRVLALYLRLHHGLRRLVRAGVGVVECLARSIYTR